MNEYQKMLHEIERKKLQLEINIASAVSAEIQKWQEENKLPVQSVYINLSSVYGLGQVKRYEVTGASVDLDYKP